eukprot:4485592-Amphidinium_carterae.2
MAFTVLATLQTPCCKDCFSAHGSPLGEKEIELTKGIYGWPNEKFLVPEQVKEPTACESFSSRQDEQNNTGLHVF